MPELIYIDTNVYLDFFLNRKDTLRPLGDFAHELFRKTRSCAYILVTSTLVLKELDQKCDSKRLYEFLDEFKKNKKIICVSFTGQEIRCAKKCLHWEDRLHEILAHKSNAKYLVTRNLKDFEGDLVEIVLPENL